jgi:drug/metabolite transporter (DMT)-like permease
MIGALLSVLSALAFSLSDVLVRRGVVRASASQGAFITVLIGVPLFALVALVTGQLMRAGDLPFSAYGYLAAAGIIHYVVGRYFNYAAIGAIGAARAGPVQALALPYSIFVAFVALGEGISLTMGMGIALILVGPLIMVEGTSHPPVQVTPSPPLPVATALRTEAPFQPRQAEGYFFAVIAAASYGSSPVFIRAALEGDSGLSILGGLVSYVAAGALLLASLVIPARRHLIQTLQPTTVRLFFGAGFAVFMAQMLRFLALSLASVAVVTTLLRFASVFTLIFSWVFNRSLERITLRVVLGVLVSVAGAILLIIGAT